jgi:thiamine kinase-like enzyme
MVFSLKKNKDLFLKEKMGSFFQDNCRRFFSCDKLVSLKILPQKRIAKNSVIVYDLMMLRGKERIKKRVWGKTISEKQMKLLDYLSLKGYSSHLPKKVAYLENLKFGFSEDINALATRKFQQKMSFWEKNMANIAKMIFLLQNLDVSKSMVENRSLAKERSFFKKSLENIKKYSPGILKKYDALAKAYLAALSLVKKNVMNSVLCHFDFQPGNVFYGKEGGKFYLLDFDLCEKFYPALDLANFLSHFYVMSRYHFPKARVEKFILNFVGSPLIKSKSWKKDMNIFKIRPIIDMAQMTAVFFKKPTHDSKKVFEKLDELINLCL